MRVYRGLLIAMLLVLTTTHASIHPILPAQAIRDRKALLPIADSQVRSAEPDVNWGRVWELWVEGASDEVLSFLMFDMAEISAGSTIEGATLRLHANDGTGNGTVSLHYCSSNDWIEDGLTYNNRPAFQTEPIGTFNVTYGLAKWYEWNLTNTAISVFKEQDKRLSLVLDGYTTHGSLVVFDSRQSPMVDWRPELSVLYSYTPSSGINPVFIGLIVIAVAAASTTGLIAYTRRKKRKQSVIE